MSYWEIIAVCPQIHTKHINTAVWAERRIIYKDPFRKGKGKAIPLQAWTGPEGSRRLRLPDFETIGT